jgi:competence protein ComEC
MHTCCKLAATTHSIPVLNPTVNCGIIARTQTRTTERDISATCLSKLRLGRRHLPRLTIQSVAAVDAYRAFTLPPARLAKRQRKLAILASLCLLALFGGAWRYQLSQPLSDSSHIRFYNNRGNVEVRGTVDVVEIRDTTIHLEVKTEEIQSDGWQNVSGRILVFTPRYPEYRYGDMLQLTGRLQTPQKLDDFDYPGYLAAQSIYTTVVYPDVEVIGHGYGNRVLAWIYAVRQKLAQNIARVLPEPQASLAQGLVLGLKSNMPDVVNTDFVNSGTAHLLAISGMNLSIVTGMLVSFGIWLFGKRHYFYI